MSLSQSGGLEPSHIPVAALVVCYRLRDSAAALLGLCLRHRGEVLFSPPQRGCPVGQSSVRRPLTTGEGEVVFRVPLLLVGYTGRSPFGPRQDEQYRATDEVVAHNPVSCAGALGAVHVLLQYAGPSCATHDLGVISTYNSDAWTLEEAWDAKVGSADADGAAPGASAPGLTVVVSSRLKSVYSIHRKMQIHGQISN